MNPLVTIVMRDGSQGLPGKHTKVMHGKPLWEWSFDQARQWGKAPLIVATDIPEVLAIVEKSPKFDREFGIISYGFKGKRTDIKMRDIRQAAMWAEFVFEDEFETVIDLDATNPLRTAEHIDQALYLFETARPPALFSVTPSKRNPHFNMVTLEDDGKAELIIPRERKPMLTRRQDCPQCWDLNCNIYIYSREFLMDDRNESPLVYSAMAYRMPRWTACDIDDLDDWETVEDKVRRHILGP